MCIQIDSRCVLFNVLLTHESTDFAHLKAYVTLVKQRVTQVYIDISMSSIMGAVEENHELFKFEGNKIRRRAAFTSFAQRDFIDRTINRHLPVAVRDSLHECATIDS